MHTHFQKNYSSIHSVFLWNYIMNVNNNFCNWFAHLSIKKLQITLIINLVIFSSQKWKNWNKKNNPFFQEIQMKEIHFSNFPSMVYSRIKRRKKMEIFFPGYFCPETHYSANYRVVTWLSLGNLLDFNWRPPHPQWKLLIEKTCGDLLISIAT